jgi:hypothetical protein
MSSHPVPAPKPPRPRSIARHGELRGLQLDRSGLKLDREHRGRPLVGPDNPQFEGRFGRMFSKLPAAVFTEAALMKLGERMTAAPENPPTPETKPDEEENTGISAGYTYLGQFIDHDLTFDPASSLQKQIDVDALIDYRTPRFDLDNLYGRGPDDQPYLYRDDGKRFLLGAPLTGNDEDKKARDVPRNRPMRGERARALLGDPRNDENAIVSQLHASMLRFHNRIVDFLGEGATFQDAQQLVRWHYQWVVLTDFLRTIIGQGTWKSILPSFAKRSTSGATRATCQSNSPWQRTGSVIP